MNLLSLIATKRLVYVHTIRDGKGVTLNIRRAFIQNDHVFIDTDKGTLNFPVADVTRVEHAINRSVNVTVKGHKEEYNIGW